MKYLKTFEDYNEDFTTLDFSMNQSHIFPTEFLPLKNGLLSLNCSFNKLEELPDLPNNLEKLFCGKNNLKELPKLPETLKILNCNQNKKISKLPKLPNNLITLSIVDCSISEIPNLPEKLEYLNCDNNNLIYLPNPNDNLKIVNIYNNHWIKPIPFSYMENFNLHLFKHNNGDMKWVYTIEQYNKFSSFEFQKEFLEREPENFMDLKPIGYAKGIEETFPHLFDMDELGLIN